MKKLPAPIPSILIASVDESAHSYAGRIRMAIWYGEYNMNQGVFKELYTDLSDNVIINRGLELTSDLRRQAPQDRPDVRYSIRQAGA